MPDFLRSQVWQVRDVYPMLRPVPAPNNALCTSTSSTLHRALMDVVAQELLGADLVAEARPDTHYEELLREVCGVGLAVGQCVSVAMCALWVEILTVADGADLVHLS